jgi:hypothetical protein
MEISGKCDARVQVSKRQARKLLTYMKLKRVNGLGLNLISMKIAMKLNISLVVVV